MECFTVYADEIEGRIDPHFYRPEYTKLDKKVKGISNKKLGDYIISISGGATPDIKEPEKYYSDETEGIAFLRVQNVTPEGLNLEDVKFINKATHKGMLKRSQVQEFSLLIKITGVGRMAVSSVAPKGFVGNINQHLVLIKTENENTSKILAVFLNSDIGEKLATKRATGGTRPALDYEALKSIPIVFKPEIVNIYENAIIRKKKIEIEAQKLLDSLNDYVLDELGIKLPELKDKMIYVVNSDEVQNKRADAYYYQPKFEEVENAIKKGKFEIKELKEFITKIRYGASVKNEYIDEGIPLLRIVNIKENKVVLRDVVKLPEPMRKELGNAFVQECDLLISRSGTVGVVTVIPKEAEGYAFGSFMIKFCLNDKINKNYVSAWLNNKLQNLLTQREKIGAIQGNITIGTIESFKIPLPPLSVQNKIADEVKKRMQKAEQLQKEAKEELEKAKLEVERIILEG